MRIRVIAQFDSNKFTKQTILQTQNQDKCTIYSKLNFNCSIAKPTITCETFNCDLFFLLFVTGFSLSFSLSICRSCTSLSRIVSPLVYWAFSFFRQFFFACSPFDYYHDANTNIHSLPSKAMKGKKCEQFNNSGQTFNSPLFFFVREFRAKSLVRSRASWKLKQFFSSQFFFLYPSKPSSFTFPSSFLMIFHIIIFCSLAPDDWNTPIESKAKANSSRKKNHVIRRRRT